MLLVTEAHGHAPLVLHVVQSLRGGGAEAFVRDLIPRLRLRGIDARVLCAYGASHLTEAEARAWTGIVYCQPRIGIPRLRYLGCMRRLMHDVSPDIVHTHTHVGRVWGRAAAMLARVPRIAHTEHDSYLDLPMLERIAVAMLNRRTDATVLFSERTAELARLRESIHDLHIIPNGIHVHPEPSDDDRRIARRKLGFDENLVIIGVIANLYPHKNHPLAIDAIARLPIQTRGGIRLALFGDGPLRADLEARTKEVGIEALVRFHGFCGDLEQLLPGLDLVLTTSPREMMPVSLLESMNAGLPIIGAPHAGTLDLVVDRETGIIVRSWDPQLFADAIEWAVTHPEWRARAGSAAYLRLKNNFDIEIVADRYVDLYRRLLGPRKTHRSTMAEVGPVPVDASLQLGIITSHLPFGSSEAFLYPELKGLTDLGYKLTVLPAAPRSNRRVHNDFEVDFVKFSLLGPRTLFRALRGLRRNAPAAYHALVTIVKSKNSLRTKLKNLALFPIGLAMADEACARGITHIHAYWLSGPATAALVAAQVAKVGWSYSAHSWDIFMEDNLIAEKMRSASFGRVISEQGRRALQLRSQASKRGPLEVIHLGVTTCNQPPAVEQEISARRIRLLCPAYLLPVKGHTYLLEGLRGVVDAGVDCRCVFAGEGRLRAELARKIRDLRLESVVSMPGMIPHDVFLQQLRSGMYDAVVLASVQLGTEFEGIPVSLIEAMAAGIPCVATRTGAIGELVDSECGILVDQRDPIGIRDAIVKLAVDPLWRKELGLRAMRRVVDGFDARCSARSLATLISDAHVQT